MTKILDGRKTKPFDAVDPMQEIPKHKKKPKKKKWVFVKYHIVTDEQWKWVAENHPKWLKGYGTTIHKFEKERDLNNFIEHSGFIQKPFMQVINNQLVTTHSTIYAIYNPEGELHFKSDGFEEIQNYRLPPEL